MAAVKNLSAAAVEARVRRIGEILDDLKMEDIVVLDLREITDFTDYFVIATARSSAQMHACGDRLMRQLKSEGIKVFAQPENDGPNWNVIDYGDMIIHLFEPATRAHYDLEGLWGDARILDLSKVSVG